MGPVRRSYPPSLPLKRFVADVAIPRGFRIDNGPSTRTACPWIIVTVSECSAKPSLPKHHRKTGLSRVHSGGLQLFLDVRFEDIQGYTDAAATQLLLESLLWGSECFNRAATSVNDECLYPHEYSTGASRRCHPRARICYVLDFGYNHGRDCSLLQATKQGDGENRTLA